jgi:hypothetical protein
MAQSSKKKLDQDLKECGNCGFQAKSLPACSRCKLKHFCSRACQEQSWNNHKQNCVYVDQRVPSEKPMFRATDEIDNVKCVICLENKIEDRYLFTLPCKHIFHHKCITKYFASTALPRCPICRSKILEHDSINEISNIAHKLLNSVIVGLAEAGVRYIPSKLPHAQKDDIAEAVKLANFAARRGHSAAQYLLAVIIEKGICVKQSDRDAFLWCLKSAEQGFDSAQKKLGVFWEEGRGTKVDKSRAIFWYEKAANQGNLSAQISLGTLYLKAEFDECPNWVANSFRWFMEAAEQGEMFAECIIGVMYFDKGYQLGIINDETRSTLALHWLEKSAKQGCATAQAKIDSIQKQSVAKSVKK